MGDRGPSPGPLRYRLWCGGLYKDVTPEEVERKFGRFGEVINVSIRSSPRDTFAFIQMSDGQAVEDAIEHMDNSTSLGEKVRVQKATADKKGPNTGGGGGGRGPPPRDYRDDSRGPPPGRGGGGGGGGYRDDRRGGKGGGGGGFRGDRRDDSRGRGEYRGGGGGGGGYDRGYPPRGGYRDDSRGRDNRRGGDRYAREPPRGGYSPPPRYDGGYDRGGGGGGRDNGGRSGQRYRSRTPVEDGVVRMAGKVPVGRYKITIENVPEDMSWLELKDLGRDYGPSLTFARTYRHRGAWYGMLEFKDQRDAERVIKELDNRRVQGSNERLRAYLGPGPGGD